jgi:hypothetical protein
MKICLEKSLGFGSIYENKTFVLFLFLKREINLKVLRFLFILFNFFFEIFWRNWVFNIGYVSISYSVNIQLDIMQNW